MIKYWILSFIRPGQISQGALYLSSWLSSIILVINCLISEFLTLTPNITLQFATCYPKYEPQAIGSTGITLHMQHFHVQQSKQEWQCTCRHVPWMRLGWQATGAAESKWRSFCLGCRVTAKDYKHPWSCQNLLGNGATGDISEEKAAWLQL